MVIIPWQLLKQRTHPWILSSKVPYPLKTANGNYPSNRAPIWTTGVRLLARQGFSLRRDVQPGCRPPPSIISSGYQFISGVKHGRSVKITTHIRLVPRLRIHGAIPHSPTRLRSVTVNRAVTINFFSRRWRVDVGLFSNAICTCK